MQVLSKKANKLKSNTDFTDFRSPPDIEKLNRFYQSVRNYCERNGLVDEIIPQLSEPQDVSSELHQAIGLAGAIQAQQQRTQSATDD